MNDKRVGALQPPGQRAAHASYADVSDAHLASLPTIAGKESHLQADGHYGFALAPIAASDGWPAVGLNRRLRWARRMPG